MDLQADAAGIMLGATMAVVAITMWFLGANELMGHLPIYGAMLAILVYGSDPQLRPAVSALLPPGLGRRRQPTSAAVGAAV
jgi:hypothetical protein